MQAIILAGGEGIKLRPLTFAIPKPLLPIMNKPIIDYVVYILKQADVSNIIITVDYEAAQIQAYFNQNDFGIPIQIHTVQKFQGTAHILLELQDQLEHEFLVVPGDCLYDINLAQAIHFFRNLNTRLGLIVRKEHDLLGKAGFIINNLRIQSIIQENQEDYPEIYSDAWIYYMKKEVLALIPPQKMFDIHVDLIHACLLKLEAPIAVPSNAFWVVIGRIQPYIAANFWVLQNIGSNSYVGANTVVSPSAKLIPPYFISENCHIGDHAEIGPNAIVGQSVTIGNNVNLDNSIIQEQTIIGEHTTLHNNLVANQCTIGKRCKIGRLSIIASHCILSDDVCVEDGARVGPHLTIPAKSQISDFLFPNMDTSAKTVFLSNTKNDLNPLQHKICLKLEEGGELTASGLLSALNITESELQDSLSYLISKHIIAVSDTTPAMYCLAQTAKI